MNKITEYPIGHESSIWVRRLNWTDLSDTETARTFLKTAKWYRNERLPARQAGLVGHMAQGHEFRMAYIENTRPSNYSYVYGVIETRPRPPIPLLGMSAWFRRQVGYRVHQGDTVLAPDENIQGVCAALLYDASLSYSESGSVPTHPIRDFDFIRLTDKAGARRGLLGEREVTVGGLRAALQEVHPWLVNADTYATGK